MYVKRVVSLKGPFSREKAKVILYVKASVCLHSGTRPSTAVGISMSAQVSCYIITRLN